MTRRFARLSSTDHIKFVSFHYRGKANFLRHFFRALIHPMKHFVIHINPHDLARIFPIFFLRTLGVLSAFFTIHANTFSALYHVC